MSGDPKPVVRLDATVHGRVQGVGFRYHVQRRAGSLGLRGWVANGSDGTVRCLAEGSRADLEVLSGILRTGPSGARVDRVVLSWGAATGTLGTFRIRSGSHRGD